MKTEAEMLSDLSDADAAGDTALAQHIAGLIKAARQPQIGTGSAALAGVAQGATLGWGDEMKAGWRSLFPEAVGGKPYKEGLAEERNYNKAAREQHPYAFGASEFGGSLLPGITAALATGGTSLAPALAQRALPLAAAQGAVQGGGYSDADTAGGVARDAALGAGVGVGAYGAGKAAGAVLSKLPGAVKAAAQKVRDLPDIPSPAKWVLPHKAVALYELLQKAAAKVAPEPAVEAQPANVLRFREPGTAAVVAPEAVPEPGTPAALARAKSAIDPNSLTQEVPKLTPQQLAAQPHGPQMAGESFGKGPSRLQRGATKAQLEYRAKFLPQSASTPAHSSAEDTLKLWRDLKNPDNAATLNALLEQIRKGER